MEDKLNACQDFHEALFLKCESHGPSELGQGFMPHALGWNQYGYAVNIYLILENSVYSIAVEDDLSTW